MASQLNPGKCSEEGSGINSECAIVRVIGWELGVWNYSGHSDRKFFCPCQSNGEGSPKKDFAHITDSPYSERN